MPSAVLLLAALGALAGCAGTPGDTAPRRPLEVGAAGDVSAAGAFAALVDRDPVVADWTTVYGTPDYMELEPQADGRPVAHLYYLDADLVASFVSRPARPTSVVLDHGIREILDGSRPLRLHTIAAADVARLERAERLRTARRAAPDDPDAVALQERARAAVAGSDERLSSLWAAHFAPGQLPPEASGAAPRRWPRPVDPQRVHHLVVAPQAPQAGAGGFTPIDAAAVTHDAATDELVVRLRFTPARGADPLLGESVALEADVRSEARVGQTALGAAFPFVLHTGERWSLVVRNAREFAELVGVPVERGDGDGIDLVFRVPADRDTAARLASDVRVQLGVSFFDGERRASTWTRSSPRPERRAAVRLRDHYVDAELESIALFDAATREPLVVHACEEWIMPPGRRATETAARR